MDISLNRNGYYDIKLYQERDNVQNLKAEIANQLGYGEDSTSFYLVSNGKLLTTDYQVAALQPRHEVPVGITAVPRLVGGKGGFGSMLRAIGAQIEKTTNRDACRDLSGRRLRDINEEQRLKKWFSEQQEREDEKGEVRRKKLDRLRQVSNGPALPKIDNQEYIQKREDMVETVYDAVDEGFEKANSQPSEGTFSSQMEPETSQEISASAKIISEHDVALEMQAGSSRSSVNITNKRANVKRTLLDDDLSEDTSDEEDQDLHHTPKKLKI